MHVTEFEVIRVAHVTMSNGTTYIVTDDGVSRFQDGCALRLGPTERLQVHKALDEALPRVRALQQARLNWRQLVRNGLAPRPSPVKS